MNITSTTVTVTHELDAPVLDTWNADPSTYTDELFAVLEAALQGGAEYRVGYAPQDPSGYKLLAVATVNGAKVYVEGEITENTPLAPFSNVIDSSSAVVDVGSFFAALKTLNFLSVYLPSASHSYAIVDLTTDLKVLSTTTSSAVDATAIAPGDVVVVTIEPHVVFKKDGDTVSDPRLDLVARFIGRFPSRNRFRYAVLNVPKTSTSPVYGVVTVPESVLVATKEMLGDAAYATLQSYMDD